MNIIFSRLFKLGTSKEENAFQVQKRLFGDISDIVIFDVGAYIGQVTSIYKNTFPGAVIHSFEPLPESFEKLHQLCKDKSINAYNTALSDKEGVATFQINTDPTCNSFFPRPESGMRYYSKQSRNIREIQVQTTTLDGFCERSGIPAIDILKLDVEGAEINVLKGAIKKLGKKQIKLIYSEVMFVPHYQGGCLFHEVSGFLNQYGYSLFNLYNLKRAHNGQLRWANAIFLSPQMRARIEAAEFKVD